MCYKSKNIFAKTLVRLWGYYGFFTDFCSSVRKKFSSVGGGGVRKKSAPKAPIFLRRAKGSEAAPKLALR